MTVKLTFTRYEKYVHITEVPPKISSRMKSDQRVGMKVAGDGCRTRVAGVKVAE
jgi:hypothetical protein